MGCARDGENHGSGRKPIRAAGGIIQRHTRTSRSFDASTGVITRRFSSLVERNQAPSHSFILRMLRILEALEPILDDAKREAGVVGCRVYVHDQIQGDLAVHVLWQGERSDPAVVGRVITECLQSFGLLDHATWKQGYRLVGAERERHGRTARVKMHLVFAAASPCSSRPASPTRALARLSAVPQARCRSRAHERGPGPRRH